MSFCPLQRHPWGEGRVVVTAEDAKPVRDASSYLSLASRYIINNPPHAQHQMQDAKQEQYMGFTRRCQMLLRLPKHSICRSIMPKWPREQQTYRRSSSSAGSSLHIR